MSALMKKHPTKHRVAKIRTEKKQNISSKKVLCATANGAILDLPEKIAKKYIIKPQNEKTYQKISKIRNAVEKIEQKHLMQTERNSLDNVFVDINNQYTKQGALLKGLRYREGLNQKEFANKIGIKQPELSKMENGKRTIGKTMAKRLEKEFGTNYRLFL